MKYMDDMDQAYMKYMGDEEDMMMASEEEASGENKEAAEKEAKSDEQYNHGDNLALEIDQDFLDEVVKLRGKEGLADAKSMLAIASERLDRVTQYLEETGNEKMAFAIDKCAWKRALTSCQSKWSTNFSTHSAFRSM